jgi:DNA-directed RNA polymerase alpha subunit
MLRGKKMKIIIEADSLDELFKIVDEIKKNDLNKSKTKENILEPTNSELRHYCSVRTVSSLMPCGIDSIDKLTMYSELDILRIPGIGKKAFTEIKEALAKTGKCFNKVSQIDNKAFGHNVYGLFTK